MSDFEKRFLEAKLTETEGRLSGYAAVFNSLSHDLGGFREKIAPGAFDRSLKEFPIVLALIEHDTNKLLATTANDTLRIRPDDRGLRVEIDVADTSYGRDILALVKRGDISGMSFRFRPFAGGDSFETNGAMPVRTLRSVQLKEVSVVVDPAYPATEVSVRALEAARQEARQHWLRSMRLRLAAL